MNAESKITLAAGNFIVPSGDESVYIQFLKLLEAEDINDLAMNHVNLWEKVENITVGELLESIAGYMDLINLSENSKTA